MSSAGIFREISQQTVWQLRFPVNHTEKFETKTGKKSCQLSRLLLPLSIFYHGSIARKNRVIIHENT